MTIISRIPVEPYKWHKGEGKQYGYKGIAMTPVEQAAVEKINQLVDFLNEFDSIAKTFGFKAEDTIKSVDTGHREDISSADGI